MGPPRALGVVVAAGGYPEAPRTGDVIDGPRASPPTRTRTCRSSTPARARSTARVVVSGGRVLCVTALGDTVRQAQRARVRSDRAHPLRRHAVPHATSAIARSRGAR